MSFLNSYSKIVAALSVFSYDQSEGASICLVSRYNTWMGLDQGSYNMKSALPTLKSFSLTLPLLETDD